MVTKAKWKTEVMGRFPVGISRGSRTTAIEFFYEEVRDREAWVDRRQFVPMCVRLAAVLDEEPRAVGLGAKGDRHLDLSPGVMAEWKSLMSKVIPSVEALRWTCFGQASPPYAGSYSGAVTWLTTAADEQASPTDAEREQARKLVARARKLLKTPIAVQATLLLFFADDYPSVRLDRLKVLEGSSLVGFCNGVRLIAKQTGTAEPFVVDHVLTGFPLVPPAVRIQKAHHFGGRTALTIHLPSAQTVLALKGSDLRRLVRAELDLTKAKQLSAKDRRFYERVAEAGGPPVRDDTGFWQGVAKENGLGSRRAAKNKYWRLHWRLNPTPNAG